MADTLTSSDHSTACTPLEQEVLDEYALLRDNLNRVRPASRFPLLCPQIQFPHL